MWEAAAEAGEGLGAVVVAVAAGVTKKLVVLGFVLLG
jgi:hypothetical protein